MGRVEGKVALITGGARGLGEATGRVMAQEGATVILTDVLDAEGEAVAKDILANGGKAAYLHQDVTDEAVWAAITDRIVAEHGRLDIVVNNAGIVLDATVEDTTLEGWRRVNGINNEAVFLGTREAIRVMKAQDPKGGSIVNISSIAGLVGIDNLAAYNASKGAVRLFTKSAALHAAKSGYGIRVNSVHPSYTWTPMVQHLGDNTGDRDAFYEALAQAHPIGRPGQPMDIAYGVLYLASDEASWVTGSELVIDGGITAA
ncbi:glucose 1-dehydrogenase [Amycolatopsis rhizosphaerae]|uniref:Glucose 1-dehydrogenase n=1 Tax=Amycolatopsis rhizosphaerae TaxID=2053003 RepID=A0A558DNM9_9PSEU|nr:glucose 1-dehydrogenase [Amycolatopsis rhizosphaerae]TVT62617.1 glucose 1-dehydrogenase [Amycolatopsis rhizosphaerae]